MITMFLSPQKHHEALKLEISECEGDEAERPLNFSEGGGDQDELMDQLS